MTVPPEDGKDSPPAAPSRSSSKVTIVKAVVAAGLFAWLIRSGRLDFGALVSTPLSPLHGLGLLVLFVAMVLQAWRWWMLLAVQRIGLSFPRTLGLVWIGRFLAIALPGVVGGDLVLGYYVTREAPSAKVAGLSTVVVDRTIGFYTSFLLGLAAVVWMVSSGQGVDGPILQMGAMIVFCVLAATLAFSVLWIESLRVRVLAFVPERVRASLETVLGAYRVSGRSLAFCVALSLIIGVMSMGVYRIAGHAVGSPLGWNQVLVVCPLVFVATALPLTPNGIGVGETAASVLFAQFGVETGATIMLLVRLWFVTLRLPGALFYVFQGRRPGAPEL
jgi:uncharacterized protein (TIRG00374 family)